MPEYNDREQIRNGTFLRIARELGGLGTCDRKQVGALIVRDGRCISWGYNGAPAGLPHCDENHHGWYDEWARRYSEGDLPLMAQQKPWLQNQIKEHGCRNATHAEANALAYAARQGISTDGGTLYVTVSPCANCARLLIAAGIVRVVFAEEYRDRSGIKLLREAGVQVG